MGVYSGVTRRSNVLTSENYELPEPTGKFESMIELACETTRNDMNMFESLIELDFAEVALGEAEDPSTPSGDDGEGKSSATSEAAKKNVLTKLKELINSAIGKIKQFFSNAIAKVKEFFDKDKKLYEKYKDSFTASKLTGFKVKDYTPIKKYDPFATLDKMAEAMVNVRNAVTNDSNVKEEVDKAIKDAFGGEDSMADAIKKMCFGEKTEGEKELESDQIQVITDIISNGKRYASDLKQQCNKAIKALKDFERDNYKNLKSNAKGDDLKSAKVKFDVASAMCNKMSKAVGVSYNMMVQQIKAARKVWVAGGAYANKNSTGDKKENVDEATVAMIDMASDSYVEMAFYA